MMGPPVIGVISDTHGLLRPEAIEALRGVDHILHDRQALDLDPAAAGVEAVISGHSHRPLIEWRKGVLYMNPGSAGPRRFTLPISLGLIAVDGNELLPRLVTLL